MENKRHFAMTLSEKLIEEQYRLRLPTLTA